MTSALWLGLLLGLRHAADPDHVAAVASLVARERRASRASWLGAAWSLGHGGTLLLLGGASVLLSARVPEAFGFLAEMGVATLLVVLGLQNLRHARRHGAHENETPRHDLLRSGFVGVAHGLAGTGLVALAAAAAMPGPREALLYLVAFALGTSVGMVVCSLLLSAPLQLFAESERRHRLLHGVTGALSLAVGLWLGAGLWLEGGALA